MWRVVILKLCQNLLSGSFLVFGKSYFGKAPTMTLERISLLRNIGQLDSVNAGAQLPLTTFSLIYAENGRGKTTIAAILRSLNTGEPGLINERKRLGAQHPPHIVLTVNGTPAVFQNGAWSTSLPRVAVFDDAFVAANVCSGIEIETAHRQNLHELILGAQGVARRRQRRPCSRASRRSILARRHPAPGAAARRGFRPSSTRQRRADRE
jgi:wobble nucleotide-excising tRNase